MTHRRFLLLLCAFAAGFARSAALAEETPGPAAPVQALCDALIASMRRGSALSPAGRTELLGPEIRRDLDLALMTRLVVGPAWRSLPASDRQQLAEAFSDYSVATYVERFNSYSGQRFEVDPAPAPQPSGDTIVHTKLFTGGPSPVQLDYLMRKGDGGWRVMDVYLSGTISELAARRSEYSTVLRQGGAPALVALLRKKAAELGR